MNAPVPPARALIYAKAVTVQPPPGARKGNPQDAPFLLVQLILDCPVCGEATMLIAGHHLKAVVRTLQAILDTADPALTAEGETEVVERKFVRTFRSEENN